MKLNIDNIDTWLTKETKHDVLINVFQSGVTESEPLLRSQLLQAGEELIAIASRPKLDFNEIAEAIIPFFQNIMINAEKAARETLDVEQNKELPLT